MSTETKVKKKAMLKAMEDALGVVTLACRTVGIDRTTHYQWLKDDEEYKQSIEDISEVALDFAESQLHKQIKEGEVSSTIFYLKTKGKKRGYVERVENENSGETIIRVRYDERKIDNISETTPDAAEGIE